MEWLDDMLTSREGRRVLVGIEISAGFVMVLSGLLRIARCGKARW
jgi:hypothetical protein